MPGLHEDSEEVGVSQSLEIVPWKRDTLSGDMQEKKEKDPKDCKEVLSEQQLLGRDKIKKKAFGLSYKEITGRL